MRNKGTAKKGYLLVDMVLALALISILFLGIGKSYSIYIKNKHYTREKVEVREGMNSLVMEIKHNISFNDIRAFPSGEYGLSDLDINKLIGMEINNFLGEELILNDKDLNELGWGITINHIDDYESKVDIFYKNDFPFISESEEVKIYEFLE
ncbi:type II secretion system protein [Clostridium perfringens]|nr:type II secretion system protein [Clostridium perfringens]